ncbi:MAG: hypothetical protein C4306_10445 [Thermoleophilia bacterium]
MPPPSRLPPWAWLLPVATGVASVLAWTAWCDTETGTWLGGALVVGTGLLVYALSLEALPHAPGAVASLRRLALAVLLGVAGAGLALVAAGAGYSFSCSLP